MGIAILVLTVLLLTTTNRQVGATYDVAFEVSVRGVIQDVQEFYCPVCRDNGTHLKLSTEKGETILVHVAPGRYLHGNNIHFASGDSVEVVGIFANNSGSPTIVARKISRVERHLFSAQMLASRCGANDD
jgi:hypothetical protein